MAAELLKWIGIAVLCAIGFYGSLFLLGVIVLAITSRLESHSRNRIMTKEQDWIDVPADEMSQEQLKQAVKDLRKTIMELRGL